MKIMGFQKITTLDYPDTVAAIVFTYGCNFLCPFCHNSSLVLVPNMADDAPAIIDEAEILDYLEKRKNVLQGLCISGGEPLLQHNIEIFIKKVKSLGLKIKLDTNGSYPQKLKQLLDNNLIDYVAMDIKNAPERYAETIGLPTFDISPIMKSAEHLRNSGCNFEFRITLVKELHSQNNLEALGKAFCGKNTLYLQHFVHAESIINNFINTHSSLTPFSLDEMKKAQSILSKYFESVIIRGI